MKKILSVSLFAMAACMMLSLSSCSNNPKKMTAVKQWVYLDITAGDTTEFILDISQYRKNYITTAVRHPNGQAVILKSLKIKNLNELDLGAGSISGDFTVTTGVSAWDTVRVSFSNMTLNSAVFNLQDAATALFGDKVSRKPTSGSTAFTAREKKVDLEFQSVKNVRLCLANMFGDNICIAVFDMNNKSSEPKPVKILATSTKTDAQTGRLYDDKTFTMPKNPGIVVMVANTDPQNMVKNFWSYYQSGTSKLYTRDSDPDLFIDIVSGSSLCGSSMTVLYSTAVFASVVDNIDD